MTLAVCDAARTAACLPFGPLVDALAVAAREAAEGRILSPARLAVPLRECGVMLSMPAAADDIAIHKLVNVCPGNRERDLPTIQGQVVAYDPGSGEALVSLDGPTVTGRRTAGITMLGARTFLAAAPREVLLYGIGTQAAHHLDALAELYPEARVRVKARSVERAAAFCARWRESLPGIEPFGEAPVPDSVDLVIAVTTSATPVYHEAARAGRLVVGVGVFTADRAEIAARTVNGSALFVDDPDGAHHEAGDLILAGVDWARVGSLAGAIVEAEQAGGRAAAGQPVLFKSVGCAAWDLAAGRVALATRARAQG
ncbi:bifunctional Delta(1)-pyrroline-2-carboxylate/Delta(1)-piperideine-2-carboxylate reductase [Burkholderia gladioli]|uniref:bifunctional Delta(1)-pyrroline-2-carboxylate/Delta(1)-piperideine-2- carboxylate reductase n=1 Tax=Burkholderia gladioli TaxID=28095 RepID=UPI00163F56BE|nr:bifunctional Delta(1)-pyrroline-2-carboxylate/Delta(1)-piperideine-2-carboxylate reductase [Burkholderia gladioli]